MEHHITTTKGRSLHLCDTPGERGTIIAVHGLTGHHQQMQYYQRKLAGTYRVISYDMRGRGRSDDAPPDSSIFTHADDLLDLIDTLGVKAPILMGYSMGAYVCALAAAQRSDVEALILLDGAGEAESRQRELIVPSLERLRASFASEDDYAAQTKALYEKLGIFWNDEMETIARYEGVDRGGNWEHRSDYDQTLKDFDSFYAFDPEAVGPAIACPVLLVIAEGKMGTGPSLFHRGTYHTLREAVPSIQTVLTPVNHYELVFNEQPDVLQAVQDFLAGKEE
ncbi:alpha/beta fold hydrolase [Salibacterium sp. K-3]